MTRKNWVLLGLATGAVSFVIGAIAVALLIWLWSPGVQEAAPPMAVAPEAMKVAEAPVVPPAAAPEQFVPKYDKPAPQAVEVKPWIPEVAPEHDVQAEYAAFPYVPGWPIKVKGTFNSTPVVADLEGNGTLSIVTTARCSANDEEAGGKPESLPAMVFALNLKGEVQRNFPIYVGAKSNHWEAGVSVYREGAKDRLVAVGPDRSTRVIGSEGTIVNFFGTPDSVDSPLLVDINHDGIMDVFAGRLSGSITELGGSIPNWSKSWGKKGAYAPVAGDVQGNGHYVMYQLMHTTKGTNVADVMAFDETGNKLNANWPKVIDDASWHSPVMGDICGDDKAEVVAVYGSHIFAWGWDGSVLPNTRDVPEEGQTLNGVLVDDVHASSVPPALADLDGDGKAEIITYDHKTKAIRAWHGDGTPFGSADGIIAKLPNGDAVSVVSLGDEAGVMDFFCGTYWVRRHADGKTEIKNMAPDGLRTASMTQPTIVDHGDGLADVLFVTGDGRMFIYRTGLKYNPEKMQWPTFKGDFQHTGMWKKRR